MRRPAGAARVPLGRRQLHRLAAALRVRGHRGQPRAARRRGVLARSRVQGQARAALHRRAVPGQAGRGRRLHGRAGLRRLRRRQQHDRAALGARRGCRRWHAVLAVAAGQVLRAVEGRQARDAQVAAAVHRQRRRGQPGQRAAAGGRGARVRHQQPQLQLRAARRLRQLGGQLPRGRRLGLQVPRRDDPAARRDQRAGGGAHGGPLHQVPQVRRGAPGHDARAARDAARHAGAVGQHARARHQEPRRLRTINI
mmetsp:Transcript_2804/g.11234  ORF Transcript_2804/g.11234 Transcript_2804/m.11234 type:complete len:253 (+) Transcript_2804:1970-2728(+)